MATKKKKTLKAGDSVVLSSQPRRRAVMWYANGGKREAPHSSSSPLPRRGATDIGADLMARSGRSVVTVPRRLGGLQSPVRLLLPGQEAAAPDVVGDDGAGARPADQFDSAASRCDVPRRRAAAWLPADRARRQASGPAFSRETPARLRDRHQRSAPDSPAPCVSGTASLQHPAQLRWRCAIAGPAEPREFRDSRSPARPTRASPPGVLPTEGDGGRHGDGACHPSPGRFVRLPAGEGRRRHRHRPCHGAPPALEGAGRRARASSSGASSRNRDSTTRRPAGCRFGSSARRRPHRGSRQAALWRASRRPGGTSRSTWTAKSILARCSFARARPWRGLRSHAVWRP